jgi:hypothetical protein
MRETEKYVNKVLNPYTIIKIKSIQQYIIKYYT